MTIRIGTRLTLPLRPHRLRQRRSGKLRAQSEQRVKNDPRARRGRRAVIERHAAADPAVTPPLRSTAQA